MQGYIIFASPSSSRKRLTDRRQVRPYDGAEGCQFCTCVLLASDGFQWRCCDQERTESVTIPCLLATLHAQPRWTPFRNNRLRTLWGYPYCQSDVPDAPQPRILTKYFAPSGFLVCSNWSEVDASVFALPRQQRTPHRRLLSLALIIYYPFNGRRCFSLS
jgi:hypothetical protein